MLQVQFLAGPSEDTWAAGSMITVTAGVTDNVTVAALGDFVDTVGTGATWTLGRSDHQEIAIRGAFTYGTRTPEAPANEFVILDSPRWSGWGSLEYKLRTGPFALYAAAELYEAINHREYGGQDRGSITLQPEIQVTPRIAAFLGTGMAALTPYDRSFLDGPAAVPVLLGILWQVYEGAVIRGIDLSGWFGFDNLRNPNGPFSRPIASVSVSLRF